LAETRLDVVGFGALNLDVIYRVDSVEEVGLDPATEVVGTGDHRALEHRLAREGPPIATSAGGSAANTVYALGRMGLATGFVGLVGEDQEATILLDGLGRKEDIGVTRRGLSGRAIIAVDKGGERSITVFPNVKDTLRFDDVGMGLLSRTRVVHMTSFVGDRPMEAQLEAVRHMPQDVILSLDPGALYARRGLKAIAPLLSRARVVFVGEDELLELADETDRDAAARRLRGAGAEIVVCKLGPRGIHTFWEGRDALLKAKPVVVKGDTVGAGDVAAAGFLAGMLVGLPPDACAVVAHGCAVESLRGFGRASYPDASVLARLLEMEKSFVGH
jgi:ribokinase